MRAYFLRTERAGFSTWQSDDLPLARLLWGDGEVTRYISATGVFTEEQIAARLQLEMENQRRFGVQYWPVFSLLQEDFIGCCGLRPYPEDGVYEMGFHLRRSYWGMGLGTELARAAIGYAFETLKAKDLFAGHNPANLASQKVLMKLGFHYVRDEFYPPTGLYHPSYRYREGN
jgi:RimJ/RimL family protein N-acetyltransferase